MNPTKFKISYKFGGLIFTAVAETLPQAYECIKAIVYANRQQFTDDPDAILTEDMMILVDILRGNTNGAFGKIYTVEGGSPEGEDDQCTPTNS